MAAIGSIRKRSGLLVFLIGGSLVGFLVMEGINSQVSVFRGRNTNIAKVNGNSISYTEFEKKYEDIMKSQEDQARQMGQEVTDDQRNQLKNSVWNEMVEEQVFAKSYNQLGIAITDPEMTELTAGDLVSDRIKQMFGNPQTGEFNPQSVANFVRGINQKDPNNPNLTPDFKRRFWASLKDEIMQQQFREKYYSLISKGLYVPTWMAEMQYNDQARTAAIKYVQLPYNDVNDNDVKVTDDDLKKYLDGHQAMFKNDDETRRVEYVAFNVVPSATDTQTALHYIETKSLDLAKGKTFQEDSILFTRQFHDQSFDEAYLDAEKLATSPIKDSLFSKEVKSLVGPYLENGSFKMAKIVDRKLVADSVRVRWIKFSLDGVANRDQLTAKENTIDSVYKAIDSAKVDFGMLAAQFSSDDSSKNKGGDIGWIKEGKTGKKSEYLNNLLFFKAEKGKPYVYKAYMHDGENASYIVEVTDGKPSKTAVQVAYIAKEIEASQETNDSIYRIASTFITDNQSEAKFREAAKKNSGQISSEFKKEDFVIQPLVGSARGIVKWAFSANVGEDSLFSLNKKFVITMLDQVHPKGVQPLDAVRDLVKAEVLKEKKGELLTKKLEDAKAGSIDELASKVGKQSMEAPNVSFSMPNLADGPEPAVVATALSLGAGKMSKPVQGEQGVYVVQATAIQEPPATADPTIMAKAKMQLQQEVQSKLRYVSAILRKISKVDDYRSDWF